MRSSEVAHRLSIGVVSRHVKQARRRALEHPPVPLLHQLARRLVEGLEGAAHGHRRREGVPPPKLIGSCRWGSSDRIPPMAPGEALSTAAILPSESVAAAPGVGVDDEWRDESVLLGTGHDPPVGGGEVRLEPELQGARPSRVPGLRRRGAGRTTRGRGRSSRRRGRGPRRRTPRPWRAWCSRSGLGRSRRR
ncbi:hypothetical protein ACHAWF_013516 [Thalassiosira exigua]